MVNEYIERGVKEVPSRLNLAVDDVELYARNTKKVRATAGGGGSGTPTTDVGMGARDLKQS